MFGLVFVVGVAIGVRVDGGIGVMNGIILWVGMRVEILVDG